MGSELTRQMFEYLAELARMNVKQVRTIEQWKVEGLDRTVWFLSDIPDHPKVQSRIGPARKPDPGILLSISKPVLPDPPRPDPVWLEWRLRAGVHFEPRNLGPVPRPSEQYGGELDPDAEQGGDRYEAVLEPWRKDYGAAHAVLNAYSKLWEARQLLNADPERWDLIGGLAIVDWSPDGFPVRRPMITMPARIEFLSELERVDVEIDESALKIETDMLPPTHNPGRSAADDTLERLADLDDLYDADALQSAMTFLVGQLPHSGGRGTWDPSIQLSTVGGADPRIVFAPVIAIRPRSAQARLQLLLDLASAPELSTGMRSLVELTDAHLAALPRGQEVEDRFLPELLLPEPSSPAQRQMALSMERNPLTVVFGPPGTGKTYTIANLLGHLLAKGKRVIVTAEKEEALHEVREKVLPELQDLVVPVLKGTSQDRQRLSHAIERISAARQERQLADRNLETQQLDERVAGLREERAELLNALGKAWEEERDLRLAAGPYRGSVEEVASSLARDRNACGWLTDRPGSPALEISDEELTQISRLAEPAVAGAGMRSDPLPVPDEILEIDDVGGLASKLRASSRLGARSRHALPRSAALAAPATLEEALVVADGIGAAAATLEVYLRGAPGWVQQLLVDVRNGDRDVWRGISERTAEEAATLTTGLERLGGHEVTVPGDRDPSAIRGSARAIAEQTTPDKPVRKLLRGAQLKEAVNNLKGVLIDGSRIDTHEEALAVQGWAEATLAYGRFLDDWRTRVAGVAGLTLRQAHDRVRQLSQQLSEAQQVIDKVESVLAPVKDAGVELEDGWSAEALRLDEHAVREVAEQTEIDRMIGHLVSTRERISTAIMFGNELRTAITALADEADPEPWIRARYAVQLERELRAAARAGLTAKDALARALPEFVSTFDTQPEAFFQRLPRVRDATVWAHAVGVLAGIGSRRSMLTRLDQLEARLSQARRDLVIARAWRNIHQRLTDDPSLAQALRDYAAAQGRVPKTKSAKSYLPNLRRAQRALERCTDAVPVWVMAIDQVAEMFGTRAASGAPVTDVVIVDEASQSPITSAFVMQLAEAVAIVGDPYQTAPPSFKRFEHLEAARQRISDRVVRDRLDPEVSLWEIGAVAIDRIALTEHFRCPPEVIGWAQERIYRQLADIELVVLSGTDPRRPKPLIVHHVPNGVEDATNPNEGMALVADLEEVLADRPAWVRDVGIVARTSYQAGLIQRLVFDRFDQRTLEAVNLRVGIPYQFQGAQRDLMYLSMTDGPPDRGDTWPLRSFSSETVNQMNVAVSRARRQLRVFHSCVVSGYKPDDVRRSLLEHALDNDRQWELRSTPGVPPLVPEDVRVEPFDSLSEQRLYNGLVTRGFAVRPHVEAPVRGGRYWLDFVVDGPSGHVAIEYDGPHHDAADQYLSDRERECDLARCGWTILRVHHTEFNVDREAAADAVATQLRRYGVIPVAEWDSVAPHSKDSALAGVPDAGIWDVVSSGPISAPEEQVQIVAVDERRTAELRVSAESAVGRPAVASVLPASSETPIDDQPTEEPLETGVVEESRAMRSVGDSSLTPYSGYAGRLDAPLTATREELVEGIVAIVEAEGPIVGDRLIQVYNRAGGGQRAGKNIRGAINSAITIAARRGLLVEDNPLNVQGVKFRTYRLPHQAAIVERSLGPRDIHEVPPAELASRLRRARFRGFDRESCFRALLDEYGLVRLTDNTRRTLMDAWQLVVSAPSG